jgi:hypothetical protein
MSETNFQTLILTVGKAVIPIVNSIQNLKPDRVIFVCSKKFESLIIGEGTPCEIIQGNIVKRYPNIPTMARLGNRFQAERDLKNVQNPDDLTECYQIASSIIKQLKELHPNGKIYADYTGGTKTMSLGLALASLEEGISLQVNSPVTLQTVTHSRQELPIKSIGLPEKKLLSSSALNALRVGNFKAFADTQYIPLRPLTLIFGANSSGKSSVLHSLLLSHHAIQTGELDINFTKAGGESVDLGGFGQYIHKRDINNNVVNWAVDIDPKKINLADQELINLLEQVKKLTVGLSIGNRSGQGRVRVRSFFIEADGNEILNMSYRPKGRLQLDSLDNEHPIIRALINAILEANRISTREVSLQTQEEIKTTIDLLVPEITARVSRFLPTKIQVGEEGNNNTNYQLNPKLGQTTDLAETVRLVLPYRLNNFIEAITDTIEQEIRKLKYLGPFRTYPPRHFAFSRQQDINWYAGGGYAWDILLNDSEVRQKVNAWLGDSNRMKTPYELKVRKLLSDTQVSKMLDSRITNKLRELTTQLIFYSSGLGEPELQQRIEQLRMNLEEIGIDFDNYEQILAKLQETEFFAEIEKLTSPENNPHLVQIGQRHPIESILLEIKEIVSTLTDVDTLSDTWVNEMTNTGEKISDLVLIDKRTNTPVSHRDVGIGVSQVIPILVSCYGLSDALVAIEQPEIHLHPKLQAELGDVFIESALGEQKNTFILETHSEHLLLRIMRRMRETYNNELPEGCLPVRPEDVSVLFVESDSRGSFVREMPLNKRGELVKAWPGGFFEEELDEIF